MLEALQNLDGNILLWIQEYLRNDWLTPIFIFVTNLGKAGFIWIVLAIGLMITKKTRMTGIMCAVALIIFLVLNNMILKNLVARPRPYDVIPELVPLVPRLHDFSFPSGHTASSFAVATVILYKLSRRFSIPVLILAILISLSRLYLGVHYPTDVIFAAFEGIVIGRMAIKMVNSVLNKTNS